MGRVECRTHASARLSPPVPFSSSAGGVSGGSEGWRWPVAVTECQPINISRGTRHTRRQVSILCSVSCFSCSLVPLHQLRSPCARLPSFLGQAMRCSHSCSGARSLLYRCSRMRNSSYILSVFACPTQPLPDTLRNNLTLRAIPATPVTYS